jgi:hypothetical protein
MALPGSSAALQQLGNAHVTVLRRLAPGADGGTVVEIEHRGWERFGQAAPIAAPGTSGAGAGRDPLFVAVCWPGVAGCG